MWMVYELRLLPPFVRKGIAVSLLVVLLSGVGAAMLWPFLTGQAEIASQLDQRYALLGRYDAIANYADRLGELNGLAADDAARSAFYPDRDPAIISAELQGRVAAAVNSSGADLHSTRPISIEPTEHLSWVGVQANLFGALDDVQEALVRIEQGRPLLFIRSAHFRAGRSGLDETGNGPLVDVSLDIRAAIWREPRK